MSIESHPSMASATTSLPFEETLTSTNAGLIASKQDLNRACQSANSTAPAPTTAQVDTAVGLIYGVQNLRTLSKKEAKNPFVACNPGIYRPPHITPRIPAQRSIFTVHSKPTKHFKPRGLREWFIAPQACLEIKRVLDACAINESSLFPDVDGLSRYLGWRYKWGKL